MRPIPIKEENENFKLTVAKKYSCLFLSGLSPETRTELVKVYIEEVLNIETKCGKMETRRGWYKSCIKLHVSYVMNSEMWLNKQCIKNKITDLELFIASI